MPACITKLSPVGLTQHGKCNKYGVTASNSIMQESHDTHNSWLK